MTVKAIQTGHDCKGHSDRNRLTSSSDKAALLRFISQDYTVKVYQTRIDYKGPSVMVIL